MAQTEVSTPEKICTDDGYYQVKVNNQVFEVEVSSRSQPTQTTVSAPTNPQPQATMHDITAPLAGQVYKITVEVGARVHAGDIVMILEAMKMETEIRASHAGSVGAIHVQEGHNVTMGSLLLSIQAS